MPKLILLFVIFLSAVILGTYLNYPIENMNGSLTHTYDNGVNKKNYKTCLACADNKKCAVLTADGEVQCSICNLNYISDKTPKELCLNSWDDEPRGFGCDAGFNKTNYAPTRKGCHKDSSPDPIPSDDEVWGLDKCLNHFKETDNLDSHQVKKTYKPCDRLTESICDNNCGDYCKWDIDGHKGKCKLKNKYKGYM
jgi:hypothetical protein